MTPEAALGILQAERLLARGRSMLVAGRFTACIAALPAGR